MPPVSVRPRLLRDPLRIEDLLLLTKHPLEGRSSLEPGRLQSARLLALVTQSTTVDAQSGARSAVLKLDIGSAGSPELSSHWQALLTQGHRLHAVSLTSLVPQMREFAALCALRSTPQPLLAQLLAPVPPQEAAAAAVAAAARAMDDDSAEVLRPAALPAPMHAELAASYNASQAAAIRSCLDARSWPWALVQGPPGTGKTSAIVGIISALLVGRDAAAVAAVAGGDATAATVELQKPGAVRHFRPSSKRREPAAEGTPEGAEAGAADGPPRRTPADRLVIGRTPQLRVLVCAQSNAGDHDRL